MAKCRRHGWIRAEILCKMVWSRDSLLSRRPFSCQISVFMSPPLFADPDSQKRRRHKNVRAEILYRMPPQLPPDLYSGVQWQRNREFIKHVKLCVFCGLLGGWLADWLVKNKQLRVSCTKSEIPRNFQFGCRVKLTPTKWKIPRKFPIRWG